MNASYYESIRKWCSLFVMITVLGLVYSLWSMITGAGTWLWVGIWFLVVVGCLLVYSRAAILGRVLRRRQVLAEMACPSCGMVYGMEVALHARDEYVERIREAKRRQQNPKDLGPFWHVRCPKCLKDARYEMHTFKLESLAA